jgi:hypothetical protein
MSTRTALARLAVVIGSTLLIGAGCSGEPAERGELGTVREVVVSESTSDDGVTESLIVTLGTPAELALEAVDTGAVAVAPWEFDPGDACVGRDVPVPTGEHGRGIAMQRGVHVAYFIATYADADAAHEAQSSLMCYHRATAALATDVGRTPGTPSHEQRQEMGWDGAHQTETRISPPMFQDDGPVVFSGRVDEVVAFLVDLDNGLDEFDGPNLAVQLAESAL